MSPNRLLASALLAVPLVFGAGQASAADFCVDTTGYDPSPALSGNQVSCDGVGSNVGDDGFLADALNGSYVEKFQVTQGMSSLEFTATILADWNAFIYNGVGVNGTSLDNGYNIYAVVTAEGFISGANSFTATEATLNLYIDLGEGSSLTLDDIDDMTLAFTGGDGNDVLLGSSSLLLSGSGTTSASGGSDGFAVTFGEFMLAPGGEQFFIAPRPFYLGVYSDGDINDGTVETVGVGLFSIEGDLSAEFFEVPEPSSLALAGLALIGLGAARRRKV